MTIAFKSETAVATNGARVEVGTVTFQGREFAALGSVVDEAAGVLYAYPTRDKVTGAWTLTTWEGKALAPLTKRNSWKQYGCFGGFPCTIVAWSCEYNGRRYSGRNSGEGMLLRMRAGKVS